MKQNQQSATTPKISSEDVIPSEATKSNIGNNGETPKPGIAELFKLGKIRVDQSYLADATADKRLTSVPIGKPNGQIFIRVRPDENYRADVALLSMKEDSEIYLVSPAILDSLDPGETYLATLFTFITRSGTTGLWPVRLPGPDGRQNEWHAAQMLAAQAAMEDWLRIKPNNESKGYDLLPAKGVIAPPRWPKEDFATLIEIGFRRFYIDSFDHPALKRLRGEN